MTEQPEGGSVSPKEKSEARADEVGKEPDARTREAQGGEPAGVVDEGQAPVEAPAANDEIIEQVDPNDARQGPNQDMQMDEQNQMDEEEMD